MEKMIFSVTVALYALIAAAQAVDPKFCAAGSTDQSKCTSWSTAMKTNGLMNFTCVNGKDAADCYMKIHNKEADIGIFDGGEIFDAGKKYGMKVIAYEHLETSPGTYINYFAVAVVKKNSNLTLATLKGSKSCHTGYGKTSGWKVPMGILLEKGYLKWAKDCDQFQTAADFFNKSCVPGAKGKASNLCELCSGSGDAKCDAKNEPYSGYDGAFKCLKDGAGDVAFIKEATIPVDDKANYMLLCANASMPTANPSDVNKCNLARAPAHGVLARKDDSKIGTYITLLTTSSDKFNKTSGSTFQLFDGKGIFSSSTDSIKGVEAAKQRYDKYLDSNYMKEVSKLEGCKKPSKAWSTTGAAYLIMASVSMIMALIMP